MRHQHLFVMMMLLGLASRAAAQGNAATAPAALTFKDRGKIAVFPLGAASFADEIVTFTMGTPAGRDPRAGDPSRALGVPDYTGEASERKKATSLTVGCGGVLTVRFADNALVDVDGPDLHVFEVGPAIEPTLVEISADGQRWIDVGRVAGGLASLDIAGKAVAGEAYHYVRLTDARTDCGGTYPGADIDAIGAIGSALQLSLSSEVLFDSGKATLKPEAQRELQAIAAKLTAFPRARVSIEGHTDGVGTAEANRTLSEARARSVREFFAAVPALATLRFTSRGFGEDRPVTSNETDAGRQRNRRVELLVSPAK